jgi:hypothetical protein
LAPEGHEVFLEVQLLEGVETTFDESLHQVYRDNMSRGDYRALREAVDPPLAPRTLPSGPPGLDPGVRERILSEYLATSGGRRELAASMIQPLRTRMDYQSISRRAFIVEELPSGAIPNYLESPTSKQDAFELPSWVESGTWVKNGDVFATVIGVELGSKTFPFRSTRVEYQIWRDYGPTKKLDAYEFCEHWLPSEIPSEPRTRFQRILDEFDD